MNKRLNIRHQRFGRLVVLEQSRRNSRGLWEWWCRCDCGTERWVVGNRLTRGVIQSCGCLFQENLVKIGKHRLTHGHTAGYHASPTYYSWTAMVTRCKNTKRENYARYGGRGVTVCDRWMKFEDFLADMGERPEGTSIDRIDPAGNYEPGNCRWATAQQQEANKLRKRDGKYAA